MLFTGLKVEAASYYSHNFERVTHIPLRLAVNVRECAELIDGVQTRGIRRVRHGVGAGTRGYEHNSVRHLPLP